jgi:curli biogenesis system outer membrane secretion channel CsgG
MRKLFFAVSLLSCVVCSSVFAQTPAKPAQVQSWKPPVSTLTRAQVERSLVHAEKDGQLQYLDTVVYRGSR